MSAEIINLRRARKARARADKDRTSAENRAKFGRSKAERAATDAERQLHARNIEGAARQVTRPDTDREPGESS